MGKERYKQECGEAKERIAELEREVEKASKAYQEDESRDCWQSGRQNLLGPDPSYRRRTPYLRRMCWESSAT